MYKISKKQLVSSPSHHAENKGFFMGTISGEVADIR